MIYPAWELEGDRIALRKVYAVKSPTGQFYALSFDREELETYIRQLSRATMAGWTVVSLEVKH